MSLSFIKTDSHLKITVNHFVPLVVFLIPWWLWIISQFWNVCYILNITVDVKINVKVIITTFPGVAIGHFPILCKFCVLLKLHFFPNRSHWYLAVICFPWLEEAVYEDYPQTDSQQAQAQQSQCDNKAVGNAFSVDVIIIFLNNEGNSKIMTEISMKFKVV